MRSRLVIDRPVAGYFQKLINQSFPDDSTSSFQATAYAGYEKGNANFLEQHYTGISITTIQTSSPHIGHTRQRTHLHYNIQVSFDRIEPLRRSTGILSEWIYLGRDSHHHRRRSAVSWVGIHHLSVTSALERFGVLPQNLLTTGVCQSEARRSGRGQEGDTAFLWFVNRQLNE